ncbi:MAG: type II secretion system major pseudopilin GspG [bacterium]|nr:type II secretion system major pseudopilin GspG [bacterium]
MKQNRNRKVRNAFTLVELLVVVTILGILVAVVGVKVIHQPDKARVRAAAVQIANFKSGLEQYYIETGTFPNTEEGLRALVEKPLDADVAATWGGPYLERIPKDPWQREYVYRCPGTEGDYDIICLGKDGREGGDEAYAKDITNHNLDEFR